MSEYSNELVDVSRHHNRLLCDINLHLDPVVQENLAITTAGIALINEPVSLRRSGRIVAPPSPLQSEIHITGA